MVVKPGEEAARPQVVMVTGEGQDEVVEAVKNGVESACVQGERVWLSSCL